MLNKLEDQNDVVNSEGDFEIEVDQSSPIKFENEEAQSVKSNSIEVDIADDH